MKILVLGAGLQGSAAVADLARSPGVDGVVAADVDAAGVAALARQAGGKVAAEGLDVEDTARVTALMRDADAVIVLLPKRFDAPMARLAVASGRHFVNASYASPEMAELDAEARRRGVGLLPEFGMDPGLDLVMAGMAVRELDEVHTLLSYGAGLPEPAAADNPLRYKVSWSFADLLRSYHRPARLVRDGAPVVVPAAEIFAPQQVHTVEVEGLGPLEAFPNADIVHHLEVLGIAATVREAGRYTLRYPGHCAFWKTLVDLGFLGEEPVRVDGSAVLPRRYLEELLAPRLQYGPGEADLVLLRVDARGVKDGRPHRAVYQLLDRRDPATGALAMQRTVGYTASIGAQMLVRGEIPGRGLLSPARDVPVPPLLAELGRRGIAIERLREA